MAEHDLRSVAFPKLDESQLAALDRCPLTKLAQYRDGEKLFNAGDRDFKFYVIKSGKVESVDESGDTPRSIAVQGPGEFTGDVAQLDGRPGDRQCHRPGGLRSLRGVAGGHCATHQRPPRLWATSSCRRSLPAAISLASPASSRGRPRDRPRAYSRDTFPCPRIPGQEPGAVYVVRSPRPIRESTSSLSGSRREPERHPRGHLGQQADPSQSLGPRGFADALGIRRPLQRRRRTTWSWSEPSRRVQPAAVYAASEGLNTIVLERVGPGGQAGRSMRIENYLGFPTGITGSQLAERAALQANKFAALIVRPHPGHGTDVRSGILRPAVGWPGDNRRQVRANRHRGGLSPTDRRGLRDGSRAAASIMPRRPWRRRMCRGSEVVVVGVGNSAGQAAVFLAGQVRKLPGDPW